MNYYVNLWIITTYKLFLSLALTNIIYKHGLNEDTVFALNADSDTVEIPQNIIPELFMF